MASAATATATAPAPATAADANSDKMGTRSYASIVEALLEELKSTRSIVDSLTGVLKDYHSKEKVILGLVKELGKEHQKVAKERDALEKKRGGKRGKKDEVGKGGSPNAFKRPVALSDEICRFIGVEPGTKMSRPDVTKRIHQYIVENKLQKPEDRRIIKPDSKLKTLLRLDAEGSDNLNYFKVQTHLRCHFPKEEAGSSSSTSTE